MKPQRSTSPTSPAELARRFEHLQSSTAALDLDEAELVQVVHHYRSRTMLDEALSVADRALRKYPYSCRLYLVKSKVLTELHIYDYALEVLEQAETYGAGTPQIHIQRAQTLAGLGREEEAFAELDRLGDENDEILRSMRSFAEATIFEQMGRSSDVYFYLEQAIRSWPGNTEAFDLLWITSELTARYAQTEALCEWVLEQDAYHAKAWYNLGHARQAQGRTDTALVALEYAYIIDPRFDFAYREAGEICFETQQYARAIEVYETMMEYICCDNEVLLRLGQCYLHEGSFLQARLCINRVLSRNANQDEALYYSGLCYAAEQNWTAAIHAYRRAISLNDRNEVYAASFAEALLQTGDLARAEYYFQRAADTAPELPEYWLNYGVFLFQTGRVLEAIGVLDEAEDHTYGVKLEYLRVVLLMALGREADGLRRLAELLEDDFESHKVMWEISPELEEHDLVQQVLRCFA